MKTPLAIIISLLTTFQLTAQVVPPQPNFIFIVIDDLNDYVQGLNGQPQIQTPNISALAAMGTSFTNAYCNSPGCAPSRTSFLSGKDVAYTKVFNNEDYISQFRSNFTVAEGNEYVITLPELLKDSAGYFTYAIDKVFHNQTQNDYDKLAAHPMCEKDYSWNKSKSINETPDLLAIFDSYSFGGTFNWGKIPDSLESRMPDYIMTDSAMQFIHDYATGVANTCDKPFFLALGYNRPHSDRYIPEKYFLPYYTEDIYAEPFQIPYNTPANAFPYNGIILPPQPDPEYDDYYHLPELGVGQKLADFGDGYTALLDYTAALPTVPIIDPLLTDDERNHILMETANANDVSCYVAAVQFVDAQIGKIMDTLQTYPALLENTIIILVSDNGYSFGEKRHWTKWSLWETDLRVPFIIVDPSKPANQVSTRTASLLDIYPTVCDLASVPYPHFPDGTNYLDGHSIVSLLDNPTKMIESPSLSTTKRSTGIGGCYPHYSVRNERFHYIRYQKNNNGDLGITVCDDAGIYYEEELYDIGVNHQTDPNEWNNLMSNAAYAPVADYLEAFMPGGELYLQKAFTVNINITGIIPCILKNSAKLKLKGTLYDDAGNLLTGTGYTFKWTNSLTGAVFYGKNYSFNMASVPTAVFAANSSILFYCTVTETATGNLKAFNTNTYYINSANTPTASYSLLTDNVAITAAITGYTLNGVYTNTYWDFGDGTTSEEFLPDTHYYGSHGVYTVRNYIQYGNGCLKSVGRTANLPREGEQETSFNIFPNPANDKLTVVMQNNTTSSQIKIADITGKTVFNGKLDANQQTIQLDINYLSAGTYVITIANSNSNQFQLFEVIR